MAGANPIVTIDERTFIGRFPGKFRYQRHRNRSGDKLNTSDVQRLVKAAKKCGRQGLRDATVILMAYNHGLKVSELINLKWNHVDLEKGTLLVSRLKNGHKTIHSLSDIQLSNLRTLGQKNAELEYVFVSERNLPLTNSQVHKMVKRAGQEAGMSSAVGPDMLNGACGFNLISTRTIAQMIKH